MLDATIEVVGAGEGLLEVSRRGIPARPVDGTSASTCAKAGPPSAIARAALACESLTGPRFLSCPAAAPDVTERTVKSSIAPAVYTVLRYTREPRAPRRGSTPPLPPTGAPPAPARACSIAGNAALAAAVLALAGFDLLYPSRRRDRQRMGRVDLLR